MSVEFPQDVAAAAEALLTVENAALPLMVMAPDGRIAFANRAVCELLDYGPDDVVGRRVWELFRDEAKARDCWDAVLMTGEWPEGIAELLRRDGSVVRARSAAILVTDDLAQPRMVISHAVVV